MTSYPPSAELHCDAHGYYDGRIGCVACLRSLALAATKGPWFFGYATVRKSLGSDDEYSVADLPRIAGDTETQQGRRDGEYIAAASPDVVLGLLDQLDRREDECDERQAMTLIAEGIASDLRSQLSSLRSQVDTMIAVNDEQEKEYERLRKERNDWKAAAARTGTERRSDEMKALHDADALRLELSSTRAALSEAVDIAESLAPLRLKDAPTTKGALIRDRLDVLRSLANRKEGE